MVTISRPADADDVSGPYAETDSVPRASAIEVAQLASEVMRLATRDLVEARQERLRAEAAVAEIVREKARLEEANIRSRVDRQDFERLSREKAILPRRSHVGSLQSVAGFALGGAVLTGLVFGHNIHGIDPTYFGALVGLIAGGSMWAIRGL